MENGAENVVTSIDCRRLSSPCHTKRKTVITLRTLSVKLHYIYHWTAYYIQHENVSHLRMGRLLNLALISFHLRLVLHLALLLHLTVIHATAYYTSQVSVRSESYYTPFALHQQKKIFISIYKSSLTFVEFSLRKGSFILFVGSLVRKTREVKFKNILRFSFPGCIQTIESLEHQ